MWKEDIWEDSELVSVAVFNELTRSIKDLRFIDRLSALLPREGLYIKELFIIFIYLEKSDSFL